MQNTQNKAWSAVETEHFYEALAQFGADMGIIQHLMAQKAEELKQQGGKPVVVKTRAQIMSKFRAEQKQNPLRINKALRLA